MGANAAGQEWSPDKLEKIPEQVVETNNQKKQKVVPNNARNSRYSIKPFDVPNQTPFVLDKSKIKRTTTQSKKVRQSQ